MYCKGQISKTSEAISLIIFCGFYYDQKVFMEENIKVIKYSMTSVYTACTQLRRTYCWKDISNGSNSNPAMIIFLMPGRRRDAAVQAVYFHGDPARVHEPTLVPLSHVQDGGRRWCVHSVRARLPQGPRRLVRQVRQLLLRLRRQAGL